MSNQNKSIILFDGVCNLCNASVNFVLKNDTSNYFMFASLQSDAAKNLLLQINPKNNKNYLDSILLIEKQIIYNKSTAALLILKKMRFPFNLCYVFIVIPKFIRDYIYDVIAKNRYKWFGKRKVCMLPKKEYLAKFIS